MFLRVAWVLRGWKPVIFLVLRIPIPFDEAADVVSRLLLVMLQKMPVDAGSTGLTYFICSGVITEKLAM